MDGGESEQELSLPVGFVHEQNWVVGIGRVVGCQLRGEKGIERKDVGRGLKSMPNKKQIYKKIERRENSSPDMDATNMLDTRISYRIEPLQRLRFLLSPAGQRRPAHQSRL